MMIKVVVGLVIAIATFPLMAAAQQEDSRKSLMDKLGNINTSDEMQKLVSCQGKSMRESIKTMGVIDNTFVVTNMVLHCMDATRKFSSRFSEELMLIAVMKSFDYGHAKFAKEGASAFKWFDDVDYTGKLN